MTRLKMAYIVLKNSRRFVSILMLIILTSFFSVSYAALSETNNSWQNKLFPKPQSIVKDVQFWTKVYTEISSAQGYIHDNARLDIIYESIRLPKNLSYKARSRYTKKIKKKYQTILDKLSRTINSADKKRKLSSEEKRVLALWPDNVTAKELRRAKQRLRFQLGQSDKFKAGLIRSGQWKPYIIETLKMMGLPLEIAALPHVESSFNYKAYSKVGAAGMWQFTRSTGRRYMQVDHVLDERLDPFIASRAAARLLKNNYAVTGTWPLALTAYNHGAAGMRRAAKKVGTTDIAVILRKYKSRSFGFASRNFYPSFLAALEISLKPEHYFPNIKLKPPADYEFITLNDYISMDTLLAALQMDRRELMAANPALRPAVWDGNKYIPKSYQLRIDRSVTENVAMLMSAVTNIDAAKRFNKQKPDRYHRVTRGQTLSTIAARYGIRMSDLIASNNMRNKHMIRIGQVLILPQKGEQKVALAAVDKTKVREKNPPRPEPSAVSADGMYVVKKGDSIEQIALHNEMSVRQLLKLNKLRNKNKIYPGQKLVLIKPGEIAKQKEAQIAGLAQTIPEALEAEETIAALQSRLVSENAVDKLPVEELVATPVSEELSVEKVITEESLALLADPSDYSVSESHTIEIQAAETLGHYAEWLQLRASELRRLNKMQYGKPVVVGKHLKLNFRKVSPEAFETQRLLYHKALQEEFFEQNQIVGEDKYRLNRGDSVWLLTRKTYKIPFWLLRQYNPDLDMNRISADKIITFPRVKRRTL